MSFDYIMDAKEILDKEGYPYVFLQIQAGPNRETARRAWNLGEEDSISVNSKLLAEALRRFADDLDQAP